jgi:hypothetical protein
MKSCTLYAILYSSPAAELFVSFGDVNMTNTLLVLPQRLERIACQRSPTSVVVLSQTPDVFLVADTSSLRNFVNVRCIVLFSTSLLGHVLLSALGTAAFLDVWRTGNSFCYSLVLLSCQRVSPLRFSYVSLQTNFRIN